MGSQWACVVHLFYPELVDEILLAARQFNGDLYVTVPEGAGYCLPSTMPGTVIRLPNRGLDVGPFLVLLRDHLLMSGYQYVVKLHTKKDRRWRQTLIDATIRGRDIIENDPAIGMVGSKEYLYDGDAGNGFWIGKYREAFLGPAQSGRQFIAGTMFVARLDPFRRLLKKEAIDIIYTDMPEGYFADNTPAHAWERLFGHLILSAGYKVLGV